MYLLYSSCLYIVLWLINGRFVYLESPERKQHFGSHGVKLIVFCSTFCFLLIYFFDLIIWKFHAKQCPISTSSFLPQHSWGNCSMCHRSPFTFFVIIGLQQHIVSHPKLHILYCTNNLYIYDFGLHIGGRWLKVRSSSVLLAEIYELKQEGRQMPFFSFLSLI